MNDMRRTALMRIIKASVALPAPVVVVLCAAACQSASPASPGAPLPPAGAGQSTRTIHAGDTVTGVITGTELPCSFVAVDGGWGGACEIFELLASASGTLTVTLRSDTGLALFVRTGFGDQVDMACCESPLSVHVPVRPGSVYGLDVAYIGRPPGYPVITPVSFTLETSLFTGAAQPNGTIRAFVFGDPAKTQRLSGVRLEVLDGQRAGAVAEFDPLTGMYEVRDVPIGFVRVSALAEGFLQLTTAVSVGLQVPYELVLQRVTAQPGTSGLWGIMYAYPSKPGDTTYSAYGGVKAEILDGPLAGSFAFSNDDDNGIYFIRNLPAGLVHVRASMRGLETQTKEVVVSGETRLDFVMKPQ
jgi:hypothetical protein